jgi:hypothetical protein
MSETEQKINAEVAKALSLPIEAVEGARKEWKRNTVLQSVFKATMQERIAEKMRGFMNVTPEELKSLQGEIKALTYARDIIL